MPNPKHHEEAPCDLGKALFEPFYLFFLLIVSDRSPWQRKKMVTLPARRTGLIFFVLFLALFFFFLFECVDVSASSYCYFSYFPSKFRSDLPTTAFEKPLQAPPWFRIRSELWSMAFDTLLHLSLGSFLQYHILPLLCPSLHHWL